MIQNKQVMINKKILYIWILTFFTSIMPGLAQELDGDSVKINKVPLLYDEKDSKENIYSVSYIKSDVLSKTTSFSLFDALDGRLSGFRNYIRGVSSTNAGSILILVDGFEQDMQFISNIDIEEIESVTVHKDAAATALFGQRAANGILSIKTKRGELGKAKFDLNGTYGIYNNIDMPEYFNSYDYTGYYNEALRNDGLPELYSSSQRQSYQNGNSEFYPNTNWLNEALKEFGNIAKVDLAIHGGTKNVKYFVFANYMNNQGLYRGTELDELYSTQEKTNRFNFRSNFDIQVLKNTKVAADIGGFINDTNSPTTSPSAIYDALKTFPSIIAGRYSDGVYGGSAVYTNNPLGLISGSGYSKQHNRAVNGAFKLTQDLNDIVEGLEFNANINFFNWAIYRDNWSKSFASEYRTATDTLQFGFDETLTYGSNITQMRNAGAEFTFDYNKSWGESSLNALFGYRFSREVLGGQNQTFSKMGFFGKVSVSNQGKYFADLVMAYNGSQNFAPGNRFGFFPALALGWKVSDEDFLESSSAIDLLKVRASVGLTGTDVVESDYRFMYIQNYYWSGGYNLANDNSWKGGIVEGMPAYENAKWENSLKANLGIDLELSNNIDFGLDLYVDKRTNILVSRSGSVPSYIGISLPLDNAGEVMSKGLEATLGYTYQSGDFTFAINGYFNYNTSEIIEMNEIPRPEKYLERTGLPVGQFFGLETIGFFQDQSDINGSPKQLFSAVKPGDIKYKDQNNDGVVDEFDEIAIGDSWVPKIIYAFSPTISYKGITVEALFDGIAKRSIMLNNSQFWGFYEQRNLATDAVEGRWTESTKTIAAKPRLTTLANDNNYRSNDLWLENGSFLKLRRLELRYDLPESIFSNSSVKGIQIYLRGSNLMSIDNIKNGDPENLNSVPSTSMKNIGLKLTF